MKRIFAVSISTILLTSAAQAEVNVCPTVGNVKANVLADGWYFENTNLDDLVAATKRIGAKAIMWDRAGYVFCSYSADSGSRIATAVLATGNIEPKLTPSEGWEKSADHGSQRDYACRKEEGRCAF